MRPHGRWGESPRPRRSATSAREPVSSPRRRNGRRETYVVDLRPSDLDPYPRLGRDLATAAPGGGARPRRGGGCALARGRAGAGPGGGGGGAAATVSAARARRLR